MDPRTVHGAAPRVLLVDNYDSFTYNLVQAFLVLGAEVLVRRPDALTVAAARALVPTHVCISPGPGAPREAVVSKAMIEAFAGRVPVLGVCLGHQAITEVFGGEVVRAARPMHGKTSVITHDGQSVFAGVEGPLTVGRYHSLVAEPSRLPSWLVVSARTEEGEIMGLRHTTLAVEGVQFHPESVLTPAGPALLRNFLTGPAAAQRGRSVDVAPIAGEAA